MRFCIRLRSQETRIRSLGWEEPLEKRMTTRPSILAWKIPWTGAWHATIHGVAKSQTQLRGKQFYFFFLHFQMLPKTLLHTKANPGTWDLSFPPALGKTHLGYHPITSSVTHVLRIYADHCRESEVAQSRPTHWDCMDCSLPGSSIHGFFQARVLEWVAISFSRGSSQPRDRTQVSCIAGRSFTIWTPREAHCKERRAANSDIILKPRNLYHRRAGKTWNGP